MKALLFLLCSIAWGQATVSLGGSNYTLRDHPRVWLDGSAGALTTSLSNTAANGRANNANPAYTTLKTLCDAFIAGGYTDPYANTGFNGATYSRFANCAIRWQADGDAPSLAAAIWGMNHIENIMAGTFGCNTAAQYCSGRSGDLDFIRMEIPHAMQAYSIVRSQMTSLERATFAAKMLNDNDTAHNGISSVACTNPGTPAGTGTLSASSDGVNVTISGGTTGQLSVGSVIEGTDNIPVGVVATIVDGTHFTLNVKNFAHSFSGAFHLSPPWSAGSCGAIWFVKHHNAAPPIVPGQESHYTADYPDGNTFVYPAGNLTYTAHVAYIPVGLALADDDARAGTLLTQSYNYMIANQYTYVRNSATGFTQAGDAYSPQRLHWFMSLIAIMIKNSVAAGPDLTSGVYIKRQVPFYYYAELPDNTIDSLSYQDVFFQVIGGIAMRSLVLANWLYPGAAEFPYANYYLKTLRGDFSTIVGANAGSYLPAFYTFLDPAAASSNLSGAPTQYAFKDTDYGMCVSLGLTCTLNLTYGHAISRTGWTSTDSLVLMQSSFNDGSDHSGCGDWGSAHIYKRGYLMAGDSVAANSNREQDDVLEIGSGSTYPWTSGNFIPCGTPPGNVALITRWAGTNPTGPASSKYAYSLTDMAGIYKTSINVTRAQESAVHFKLSGQQDYIVQYFDTAISSGAQTIKYYIHDWLGGIAPGTAVAFNAGALSVTNTQTNSRLLTVGVPVAGANTLALTRDNTNGTYTGGNGYTYRSQYCASTDGSTCASVLASDWVVVHKPTTNTSGTMPTLTQLSETNFRVVQIADSGSPKVAAFAKGGVTYTSAAFTSTHSGTAQYLVAGLTSGTYSVTVNASNVATCTVAANDNTCYFESTAGAVAITGGVPTLTCDLNHDGLYNVLDIQIQSNMATAVIPCTNDLDMSGSCTIVDVQRVIDKALGSACVIGP